MEIVALYRAALCRLPVNPARYVGLYHDSRQPDIAKRSTKSPHARVSFSPLVGCLHDKTNMKQTCEA